MVHCYDRQKFFRTLSLSKCRLLSLNLTSDVILSTRLLGLSLARRRVLNWVIFSTEDFAEEFVLRSHRASPLINPLLTPGMWQEKK